MARTLTVELSDKQYAALVTRLQRADAPSPEAYPAILPIIHGEAKAIERIEVHEDSTAPTPRFRTRSAAHRVRT